MQPSTPQVRPTGVTVLAILSAVGGVFGLLGALAVIGIGGFAAGAIGGASGAAVGGFAVIGGLLVLVYAGLALAFAYGAWNLLGWAWTLGIAAQILSLVLSAIGLVTGGGINFVGIAIAVIILYYLYTPEVKRAFGRP